MAGHEIDRADLPRALSSQDVLVKSASEQGGKHKEPHRSGKLDEKKLKNIFIGSIDAGTTSSRFIIFDGTGNPIAQHQIEFVQQYPKSGYVQQFSLSVFRLTLHHVDGTNRIRKNLSIPYVNVSTKARKTSSIWDTKHLTLAAWA